VLCVACSDSGSLPRVVPECPWLAALMLLEQATLVAGEPGRAPTVMVADRTTVAMTSGRARRGSLHANGRKPDQCRVNA